MVYRERWGKYRSKTASCLKDHLHHSKGEAGKCNELRLEEIACTINRYETQKRERLYLGGVYMGSYICDFLIHHNDGTKEYLEFKGAHLRHEIRFKRNWQIIQEMYKNDPTIKFTLELMG